MSEEERSPEGRKSGYVGLATLAVCLPLLYVLSVGPVVGIASRMPPGHLVHPVLEAFYTPLEWLVLNNVQPFGPLVLWYVNLFR